MTPKQFHTWMTNVADFIQTVPSENQWLQITSKLAEVQTCKKPRKYTGTDEEIEVLVYLNKKAGRNYQPVQANISPIRERIAEGATYEQLRQVISLKVAEWSCDDKMKMYLRPATLFNRTKFAQYQGEIPTKVQLKAVQVRKCNYPGCDDPVQGQKFSRCFFHMAEEFKEMRK